MLKAVWWAYWYWMGPDLESSSSQPLLLVVNIEVVEKSNLTVEVCRDVYCC
jgi:hypothetical protein